MVGCQNMVIPIQQDTPLSPDPEKTLMFPERCDPVLGTVDELDIHQTESHGKKRSQNADDHPSCPEPHRTPPGSSDPFSLKLFDTDYNMVIRLRPAASREDK